MSTAADSPVERIKAKLDIVDEIGAVVQLRKSGKSFRGLCPFHGERTPSFYVFPDRQVWNCFGCHEGGDLFTFVMKQQGLDFREALVLLAEKAGIALASHGEDAVESSDAAARKRLRALNEAGAVWFHTQLLQASEAQYARSYLDSRGVSNESLALWRLGYAPDGDGLIVYLRGQGYGDDEMIEAGLARRREGDTTGPLYSYFRKRLIFPIRDIRGHTIAFGGRELGGGHPKYLNTPQTILFDKSATLFGLDLAREAIRRADRIILVEGYMDAIVPAQYGTRNVVAVIGSAVTEKHIQQIKKLTRRVTLALDPDAAGESATLRGSIVAESAFDQTVAQVPSQQKPQRLGRDTARHMKAVLGNGLVRMEQKVDGDIFVMELPPGVDPDEYVRQDLAGWQRAIDAAQPLAEYLIKRETSGLTLDTPKGRAEAYRRLLAMCADIPDRVLASQYADRVAHKLQMDPIPVQRHLAQLQKQRNAVAVRDETSSDDKPRNGTAGYPRSRLTGFPAHANGLTSPAIGLLGEMQAEQQVADYCLGLLIEQPALWSEMGAVITEHDFTASDVRAAFTAHQSYLSGEGAEGYTADNFVASLPDVLREVAERARGEVALLLRESEEGSPLPRKAAADAAYRLKRMRLKAEMAEIDALQGEAERSGDHEALRDLLARKLDLLRLRRTIDLANPLYG